MATELAAAYVTIIPSLKGAQKTITQQLSGINTQVVGRGLGKSLSTGMTKGMRLQAIGSQLQSVSKQASNVGQRLTSSITKPAAGAALAVGGIATALGFKRLVGIDTAQAKLKALGHDAKSVQTIMDSALKSVKGTAFGLGDAANIAASAVAAGVKPGKDLTKYLSMTSDAAAIAGIELNEMGYILNQVQTGQVAYTDSLNMLADRGIPIYQWLSKQLGISAKDVKKFASEGKISSEDFFTAIQDNIGGAAKVVGENSFKGSWDNLKASLGRLGASFLDAGGKGGGFFSQLKPLMKDLTGDIDALAPKAEELGVKFGEAFTKAVDKIKELKDQWDGLDKGTQSTILKIAGIVVVLGPVLSILGSIGSTLGGLMMGFGSLSGAAGAGGLALKFAKVGGVVGVVIGLVATLWQTSDEFKQSLSEAGDKLGKTFEDLKADLDPIIQQIKADLGPAVESLGTSIAGMVEKAVPMIQQMVEVFAAVMKILGPLVSIILKILTPGFENLGAVVERVFGLITTSLENMQSKWSDAASGVQSIANGDWSGAWASAKNIVKTNFSQIGSVLSGFGGILKTMMLVPLRAAVSVMGLDWDKFVNATRNAFGRAKTAVGNAINDVVASVRTLPGRIIAAIPGPAGILVGVGASIIGGLKSGLESKMGEIRASLQGLTAKLPDWKGPKKRDKTLLTPAGRAVMNGFLKGLESGYEPVRKSLTAFTESITKWQEKAVKKESDRLIAARRRENERRKKAGKKSLGALSRADADKQARKNVGIEASALKKANKLIAAQRKTTKGIWDDGKYSGGVDRWKGLNKGATNLLSSLTKNGNWRKGTSKELKGATLADIGKAQDQVNAALSAAKSTLAAMRDARAQLKEQIASSIKGELDLTAGIGQDTVNATGHTVKGKTTFASVAGVVKTMAAKAKAFAGKLQALIKKGIPQGLVQEVASLGSENGIKVADALLSGSSAQVKALSADYASLNSWANKAGDYVAGQMYDTGINAQLGLIKGLEKDSKKLEAAAKKIAEKLVKAVNKALGVASPAKEFIKTGKWSMKGLQVGLERNYGAVESSLVGFASELPKNANVGDLIANDGALFGSGSQRSFTDADLLALASIMSSVSVKYSPDAREHARFIADGSQRLERLTR